MFCSTLSCTQVTHELRNYSWWSVGDHIGFWRSNLCLLRARQITFLLCYHSGLTIIHFKWSPLLFRAIKDKNKNRWLLKSFILGDNNVIIQNSDKKMYAFIYISKYYLHERKLTVRKIIWNKTSFPRAIVKVTDLITF